MILLMNVCWLIALVVLSAWGMLLADSWKWRLLKAGIILAFMGIGFVLAGTVGRSERNKFFLKRVSVGMTLGLGACAAAFCLPYGRDTSIRIIQRPEHYKPPGDSE